jgi:NDP-sugar pyrophosphorylase family protein
MKAAIIAAGQGERLRQGGVLIPKPLIPIGNKPLIARVIRAATHVKATSIACIVNDLNPAVAHYLQSTSWPVPLELLVKTTTSSMESLFSLAPLLGDEPFLLFTVDAVFEFKMLKRFLTKARGLNGDGVLAVTRFVDDERPLWVRLDREHKIIGLGDRVRPRRYVTAGFYYFKPNIFDMIKAARAKRLKALRQFLGLLLERDYSLYGLFVSKTVDVDYPEDIKKAEKYLEEVGEGRGT